MFTNHKITSYAIIVALAAVLVLPVNAAELQLVIHKGKPHKELPSFKRKGQALIEKRIQRRHDNQLANDKEECAAKLEVFFSITINQGVEALHNHDRRWAALEAEDLLERLEEEVRRDVALANHAVHAPRNSERAGLERLQAYLRTALEATTDIESEIHNANDPSTGGPRHIHRDIITGASVRIRVEIDNALTAVANLTERLQDLREDTEQDMDANNAIRARIRERVRRHTESIEAIREGARQGIEQTNSAILEWVEGDALAACGMLPRQ